MEQLVILVHVIVAILLIALVLVQHGKGADAGAAFGSGASNTMFGSQGAMPFLMKVTALLACLFFATNLTLSYLIAHNEPSSAIPLMPVKTVDTTKQPSIVFPSVTNASSSARK